MLGCMVKLFTSMLNDRLTLFLDEHRILSEAQLGIRKDYCTLDRIYNLYGKVELMKLRKIKLLRAFIDIRKAFGIMGNISGQKMLNMWIWKMSSNRTNDI